MSDWGKIAGGIAGFFVGGPVGAFYGATAGHVMVDQPKMVKEQISQQKEMQASQIEAQLELAGQHAALTEKQMELQMGQRQIELLSDLYLEQDRREPRILTLPASREPPGIIDRINLWMDQALRA